jgi:hypothetical protein
MANPEREHAVIYHYSAVYRELISHAVQAAGLEPMLFEDPEIAQRVLDGSERVLIAPHEQYLPSGEDDLVVINPSIQLLRFAELFDTPWMLITNPTTDVPTRLLSKAPSGSNVVFTGEQPVYSAKERIAQAESPDKYTQQRLAAGITNWLHYFPKR